MRERPCLKGPSFQDALPHLLTHCQVRHFHKGIIDLLSIRCRPVHQLLQQIDQDRQFLRQLVQSVLERCCCQCRQTLATPSLQWFLLGGDVVLQFSEGTDSVLDREQKMLMISKSVERHSTNISIGQCQSMLESYQCHEAVATVKRQDSRLLTKHVWNMARVQPPTQCSHGHNSLRTKWKMNRVNHPDLSFTQV